LPGALSARPHNLALLRRFVNTLNRESTFKRSKTEIEARAMDDAYMLMLAAALHPLRRRHLAVNSV